MRRACRPRRIGPNQLAALRLLLDTDGLQAFPPLPGHLRPAEIWRGLRRKRLIEREAAWLRLTEAGREALRQAAAEASP
jgi:hypothetical protein